MVNREKLMNDFGYFDMRRTIRSRAILAGNLIALAGAILFHMAAHGAEPREVIVAAGSRGGTYFPMGLLIADLLGKRLPGLSVKVLETSGGVENINLVATGKATFGFVNAGTAWDAVTGHPPFERRNVPLRSVAATFPNTLHLVVRDNAKINFVTDLVGHRVSVGAPSSGTQVLAERVLNAYGLDDSAGIKRVTLGVQDSALALESGSIDAFFFGAAIPVAALEQRFGDQKLKFRLIDNGEAVKRLNKNFGPLYSEGKIPAHTYTGISKDVTALEVWDLLVVLESTDGKLVYEIARTIFENKLELASRLRSFDRLELETQNKSSVISLHPGTQRLLAERGIQPFSRQFGYK
jgi:uncharacterized protein